MSMSRTACGFLPVCSTTSWPTPQRVSSPHRQGRRLKIYYMTQPSTRPPTFVCFVNRADLFHYSYQRYLENQLRQTFGLEGTPVRFIVRERGRRAGRPNSGPPAVLRLRDICAANHPFLKEAIPLFMEFLKNSWLALLLTMAAAYLLGSVNSAIIVTKIFAKDDIRGTAAAMPGRPTCSVPRASCRR